MMDFLIFAFTHRPSIMGLCLYMIATLIPAHIAGASLRAWLLVVAWGLFFPLFFLVLQFVGFMTLGFGGMLGSGTNTLTQAVGGLVSIAVPSIMGSAATAVVLTPAFGIRIALTACGWAVGGVALVTLGLMLLTQVLGPLTFPVTIGPVTMKEPFQAEMIGWNLALGIALMTLSYRTHRRKAAQAAATPTPTTS